MDNAIEETMETGGLIGFYSTFMYQVLFMNGMGYTAAGDASLMITFNLLFTAFLAVFLLDERMSWRLLLGLALAFAGVAVLFLASPNTDIPTLDRWIGNAAHCWCCIGLGDLDHHHEAGHDRCPRRCQRTAEPLASHGVVLRHWVEIFTLWAGVESLNAGWSNPSTNAWVGIVFLAVFSTVLSYVWFADGIKVIGAGPAAFYVYLVPPFGILGGWLPSASDLDLRCLCPLPSSLAASCWHNPNRKAPSKHHEGGPAPPSMAIERAVAIGAGTMGAGNAWHVPKPDGKPTSTMPFLKDLNVGDGPNLLRLGKRASPEARPHPNNGDSWAANLTAVDDLAAAVDEATVIEAVPELPDLKYSIFAELDKLAPCSRQPWHEHVLAFHCRTGCSGRPSTTRERVIGMHFFNPVPIMNLLELVRHDRHVRQPPSPSPRQRGRRWARPPFSFEGRSRIMVTSRLGVVLGNEAIRMLADGVASAKDIDTAMVLGYKHPMGPLALDRPRRARRPPGHPAQPPALLQ